MESYIQAFDLQEPKQNFLYHQLHLTPLQHSQYLLHWKNQKLIEIKMKPPHVIKIYLLEGKIFLHESLIFFTFLELVHL